MSNLQKTKNTNQKDLYFTPKMIARIESSIQQANAGKTHAFNTIKDLDKYIDDL